MGLFFRYRFFSFVLFRYRAWSKWEVRLSSSSRRVSFSLPFSLPSHSLSLPSFPLLHLRCQPPNFKWTLQT